MPRTSRIQWESTLTCPDCGSVVRESMPADVCQFLYKSQSCGRIIRPKAGDCCVFCSYGDVPCPSVQQQAIDDL